MDEAPVDVGRQTPVGVVQTDSFCGRCGYNLHTQVVLRDERLGVLVCRCPECGGFSAAGMLTTAGNRLQQRIASAAMVLYFFFVLYVVGLCMFGIGAVLYGYLEDNYHYIGIGAANGKVPLWPFTVFGGLLAGAVGVFVATFLWHWPKRLRFIVALLPLPIGVVAVAMWVQANRPLATGSAWPWYMAAPLAGLLGLCIAAGLIAGRPIARLALRLLIPPGARQYFAFLWTVDDKVPPHVTPPLTSSGDGRQTRGSTSYPAATQS